MNRGYIQTDGNYWTGSSLDPLWYREGLEPKAAGRHLEELSSLEVSVQDNESLERALRRFKRKVQRSGLYSELRKRRFYEKPSAQRKRKREAAIRRERRRQRRRK